MSEPYQLFAIIANGIPAPDAVRRTHEVLLANGAELSTEDSFLYLEEAEGRDIQVEPVVEPELSLQRLGSWPTLGYLDYWLFDGTATVDFKNLVPSGPVVCVKMSIWERTFDIGGEATVDGMRKLGKELHDRLAASRTVMDWGLELQGFDWRDELIRLKEGIVTRSYDILDLHRPLTE